MDRFGHTELASDPSEIGNLAVIIKYPNTAMLRNPSVDQP